MAGRIDIRDTGRQLHLVIDAMLACYSLAPSVFDGRALRERLDALVDTVLGPPRRREMDRLEAIERKVGFADGIDTTLGHWDKIGPDIHYLLRIARAAEKMREMMSVRFGEPPTIFGGPGLKGCMEAFDAAIKGES